VIGGLAGGGGGGCGGHEDDGIGGGRHRKLVDSMGEDEDGVEEL